MTAEILPFPPHRMIAVSRERFEAEARKLLDRLDQIECQRAKQQIFADIAQGQFVPDDDGSGAA